MKTSTAAPLPQGDSHPAPCPFPGGMVDWITLVWTHETSPGPAVAALSLEDLDTAALGIDPSWSPRGFGNRNYGESAEELGALVFWQGRTGREGVMLQLPGTACRTLEAAGVDLWAVLSRAIASGGHVTRLDLATDIVDGRLDLRRVSRAIRCRHFRSRSTTTRVIYSHDHGREGATVYVGSRTSERFLRIYDKAAETGFDGPWVRVELELKGEAAQACAVHWVCADYENAGRLLRTLLADMLEIVIPTNDSNRGRWPLAPWWADFLRDVGEQVVLRAAPKARDILDRLNWLWTQTKRTLALTRRHLGDGGYRAFVDHLADAGDLRLTTDDFALLAQQRAAWTDPHVLSTPVLLAGGRALQPV